MKPRKRARTRGHTYAQPDTKTPKLDPERQRYADMGKPRKTPR